MMENWEMDETMLKNMMAMAGKVILNSVIMTII